MTELQTVFFDRLTKEEALLKWKTNAGQLYLMHDDLSESAIESVDEILGADDPIGLEVGTEVSNARRDKVMGEVYELLLVDPKNNADQVMIAINYLFGLGY